MSECPLRVLLVEDNPFDARLVQHELRRAGYVPAMERVESEPAFTAALGSTPDVILCDWNLPQFDALRALAVARERVPEVPFIIVSGSIGEEHAVRAIKLGAADYLLKDRLGRLGPAVKQALVQRDLRAAERRARDELRASEARYRVLADSVPQIVWTARPDGAVDYMNRRAAEYSGVEDDRLIDWNWEHLVHPDDRPHTTATWGAVLRTGEPQEFEFRLRRSDGAYRWHLARQVAVRGPAGVVERWFGTCTDIHDQKTTAELLAQDAQVLAHVRDSVVVTDPEGVVTYWNAGATRLFGWTAQEMIGRRYSERFPAEFRPELSREVRARADGTEWHGEYEDLRKDGTRVWVHARVGPIRDAAGRVCGVLGLASDLTDRKRAEESLAAVMRSVADAIVTIDERGTIGSVNPATERLFGYTAAELVGRNVRVLMPEPHSGRHDSYLENYLGTGVSKIIGVGREVEGRRKDGTTFPADLSVTEFRTEDARHFTGVVRDVTERKRLEAQFRQAQKMEAVGRLAGGVAHDFNNLLTVINGYTDLLLGGPLAEDDRAALAAVRDAGERAAGLTSQLLAFSRKAIVAPQVLDLKEVVAQAERLLRRLIGEDVALTVTSHAGPCWIEADLNQLDQVIMNLAVNARDAMPTGGRLTFETRRIPVAPGTSTDSGELRAGWYVSLAVRDTGCGMSNEVKARLFEPFFTTKGPGRGTGLGLAVVHGIVKQAGGHIWAESVPGAGTTFHILFPEAPAPGGPGESAAVEALRPGTETVLLVEDEDAVRSLCCLVLEAQGYTVLPAADGRAALAAIARHRGRIHLLVTDVVMPEMSGRALADAVRTLQPDARVLFISGYTDDAVVRHGVRGEADAFLQKPFTPLGLARKVRAVLDGAP
ncbi:PAS domain S-box protein [Gemmata sp. JC673]|uniref:histidine kinase n=1 Tax=Gemmata algarum TaxID=2975278 RepID=A0ABU5EYN6_9BACT|nr:PAS domain S-box protein [Gemmata algarum]MDY3560425.1 PAS domain S-box protein [Gemmata algarum]